MKSIKDILIVVAIIVCIVFIYKYYDDKQQIKLMELKSNSLQLKIDSIRKTVVINEKKILALNKQIKQSQDSIIIYKNQIPKIRKVYDKKYKEIVNYNGIDIYNELFTIFTDNNIQ